jgi:hypothetical protein
MEVSLKDVRIHLLEAGSVDCEKRYQANVKKVIHLYYLQKGRAHQQLSLEEGLEDIAKAD